MTIDEAARKALKQVLNDPGESASAHTAARLALAAIDALSAPRRGKGARPKLDVKKARELRGPEESPLRSLAQVGKILGYNKQTVHKALKERG